MTSISSSQKFLFGGDKPWNPSDWTSSDDRVRGGSSQSYLTIDTKSPTTAEFNGNLDIKTLGGAGFASQRTTGEDRNWNLSSYAGIQLDVAKSDGKQYTLILKDQLLPKSPNGREQSTTSWEYDFKASADGEKIFLTWDELNATYRGRKVEDPTPLDLKNVKRISVMMRR
ncbi:Galactose-binding protein [Glarea lozoyensis ATCC 20868]|uniref:Galactose-binding protein n=1 Tax=Glarea lozoyensis (strain ATCC 20868 / MF5171) TaxID=1116229 RepID=S3CVD5_GLAL2|nr:Galactose-binding protein [Glarea lozoyensis ATCC 20868]EPE28919.1 Galactose-binding protein [Glarea lozoyensis ATCC 20868]